MGVAWAPTGNNPRDMKWSRGASTEHVRDERGQSTGGGLGSMIGGLGPLGASGGVVGIIVTLLVLFLGGRSVLGGGGGFDPGGVGGGGGPAGPAGERPCSQPAATDAGPLRTV